MFLPTVESLECRDCASATPQQIVAITSDPHLSQVQMVAQLQNLGLSTRQVYLAIWEPVSTPDAGNPHPLNVTVPPKPTDGQNWGLSVDTQGTPSWVVMPPVQPVQPIVWGSVPQGWTPPPQGQPITPPMGYALSVDQNGVASWVLSPASPPSDAVMPADFNNYGAAFVLAHKLGELV